MAPDSDAILIAEKLAEANRQLDYKLGEMAEVRKAELQAEFDGFRGNNVTEARHNSKYNAMNHTQERFDLEADIESLQSWITFYRLLLEKELYISVASLPPVI